MADFLSLDLKLAVVDIRADEIPSHAEASIRNPVVADKGNDVLVKFWGSPNYSIQAPEGVFVVVRHHGDVTWGNRLIVMGADMVEVFGDVGYGVSVSDSHTLIVHGTLTIMDGQSQGVEVGPPMCATHLGMIVADRVKDSWSYAPVYAGGHAFQNSPIWQNLIYGQIEEWGQGRPHPKNRSNLEGTEEWNCVVQTQYPMNLFAQIAARAIPQLRALAEYDEAGRARIICQSLADLERDGWSLDCIPGWHAGSLLKEARAQSGVPVLSPDQP